MSSYTRSGKTIDVVALKSKIHFPTLCKTWLSVSPNGQYYKAHCPFHPDKTPSFILYSDHGYCFGCKRTVDAISMVQEMEHLGFLEALEWLADWTGEDMPLRSREERIKGSYTYPKTPLPQMAIDYWYDMLTPELRAFYHNRLLTDATIDKYRLGWDGRAYVTPIWEGEPGTSEVYSVKLRFPEGKPKYGNLKGRGAPRLFNKHVLNFAKEVCVFIGEYDTLLAEQDGFHAVSGTAGQSVWMECWNKLFDSCETIFVIPDVGELTSGYNIVSDLGERAHICQYPANAGHDYTDFRMLYSAEDFRKLVLEPSLLKPNSMNVKAYWEDNDA